MRPQNGIRVLGIAVVAVLAAGCSNVAPGAGRDSATSGQLNAQASALRAAAARQEQYNAEWSQRLTALAHEYQALQVRCGVDVAPSGD